MVLLTLSAFLDFQKFHALSTTMQGVSSIIHQLYNRVTDRTFVEVYFSCHTASIYNVPLFKKREKGICPESQEFTTLKDKIQRENKKQSYKITDFSWLGHTFLTFRAYLLSKNIS